MRERDIQKSILDYLVYKGIFHWKVNNVGTYRQDTGRYIPASLKGVPDIICVLDGLFVGIEVKTPKTYQNEAQKRFEDAVVKAGGVYIVARSIDDVEALLKTLDI